MTKLIALLILSSFRLLPVPEKNEASLAATLPVAELQTAPVVPFSKVINLKASLYNNKVLLQWMVTENELADQFEVEKSTDGTNFTMAALVFGTDKPETDNYAFYEKATDKKTIYRIRIIKKDKKSEYSETVIIEPANVLA
jgi:hypothetical protein